jgi:hypothetical protein
MGTYSIVAMHVMAPAAMLSRLLPLPSRLVLLQRLWWQYAACVQQHCQLVLALYHPAASCKQADRQIQLLDIFEVF